MVGCEAASWGFACKVCKETGGCNWVCLDFRNMSKSLLKKYEYPYCWLRTFEQ